MFNFHIIHTPLTSSSIIIQNKPKRGKTSHTGFPTRSDSDMNCPVQSQKTAGSFNRIYDLRRCTVLSKKTISCAVTAKLICTFLLAMPKVRFSHQEAQIMLSHCKALSWLIHNAWVHYENGCLNCNCLVKMLTHNCLSY